MMRVEARRETWPIAGHFTIARGSRRETEIVLAEISDGSHSGRGECVPYGRYGETAEGVIAEIKSGRPLSAMAPGAARNALDAALIDLECKRSGRRAWEILGLARPTPKPTCFTISLDRPERMAQAAAAAMPRPLLKVKLGGDDEDYPRIAGIRKAAPQARLIVDANESWSIDRLIEWAPRLAALEVALIEQPLPSDSDEVLREFRSPVPLCADESTQGAASLAALRDRYDYVNIKLDKTGGLRAALAAIREAQDAGLKVMLGCMVGTSLSMAPAACLMDFADFVDLDGPLLLARDRVPALRYVDNCPQWPDAELWG